MYWSLVLYYSIFFVAPIFSQFNDICGLNNGKRFYLEHGESGSLVADIQNNLWNDHNKNTSTSSKCTVEFITCPSCIFEVKFRYLNISINCGKPSVFDACGCDYVWIYEPPIEDASGEQFCGRFIQNNSSELNYVSQTRTLKVAFIYSNEYTHAFVLDYSTKRNKVEINGYPRVGNMNNSSQYISSPFFPYFYPIDLSVEYVINCESLSPCRISLIFTDFLIADSSIIEFFDWDDQRMYVTSGNIFRPPMILTTGPSLIIRFYANGASNYGFKASYSYILGNLDYLTFTPNLGCGGFVNNLGGAITMMNMVEEGTKFFDCVWIIKPPEILQHRKTHLYVKIVNFTSFAGTTEMVIRQGITSNQPAVEILKHPMAHFSLSKQIEHVVPISQGFYIRLRGHFGPQSQLALVFASFSYKDCLSRSDFLCHNLRCISILLNCDGFDHCGDNSDESPDCSLDPKDHRQFSKIPNFLFPKMEPYSDITTATFVFLTCSLGLIGVILAMALLLHRVNIRARQQRQIQDHLETIHAILEEGVGDVEEEIIVPDEPPDYEAPPDYEEVLRLRYMKKAGIIKIHKCASQYNLSKNMDSLYETRDFKDQTSVEVSNSVLSLAGTSRGCQSTSMNIPDSPPPSYDNIKNYILEQNAPNNSKRFKKRENIDHQLPGPSTTSQQFFDSRSKVQCKTDSFEEKATKYLETVPKYSSQLFCEIRKSIKYCKSVNLIKHARKIISFSEENLVRYFSDSELTAYSNFHVNYAKKSKLKKSYSTDDIFLL